MNKRKNKLKTLALQFKNCISRIKQTKTNKNKSNDPEYCDICECTPCDCGYGSY